MNFALGLAVTQVEFHAGVDGAYGLSGDDITVSATAYTMLSLDPLPFPAPPLVPVPLEIDSADATFRTDATGAARVATPISLATPVDGPSAGLPIHQIVITYHSANAAAGAEPPVLIDDLSFDKSGTLPPPPTIDPPRAIFRDPPNDSVFGLHTPVGSWIPRAATVPFTLDVQAESEVTAIRIRERRDGILIREYLLCGGVRERCPSDPPDFDIEDEEWTGGYGSTGEYEVTATPFDASGEEGVSDTVRFFVRNQQLTVRVSGHADNRVPVVDNFGLTIRVPRCSRVPGWVDPGPPDCDPPVETLTRVELELHDNTVDSHIYRNPRVVLFPRSQAISESAQIDGPFPRGLHDEFRATFPLPLWHVGVNSMVIHVTTETPEGERRTSIREAFNWSLPSANWGINPEGTSFRPLGIPIRATDCRFVFCKDADQDGLLDLWENVAVEALRPKLVFNKDEDLFKYSNDCCVAEGPWLDPLRSPHFVRNFVRVTPVRAGTYFGSEDSPPLVVDRFDWGESVVFRWDNAYTADYGAADLPGVLEGSHRGDGQAMQSLWEINGDALDLKYVKANRHLGKFRDTVNWILGPGANPIRPVNAISGETVERLTFEDRFLKLWVEENKHGMWWENCEDAPGVHPYDCGGGETLRPAAVNVGEPGRPFIDDLNGIHPPFFGGYDNFAGIFPDEFVWSPRRTGFVTFCGGLSVRQGERLGIFTNCGEHIGTELLRLRSDVTRLPDDDGTLITPGRP